MDRWKFTRISINGKCKASFLAKGPDKCCLKLKLMDPLRPLSRDKPAFDGPYRLRNLPWLARWKIQMLWSLLLERRTLFGMGQNGESGTQYITQIESSPVHLHLWKYGVFWWGYREHGNRSIWLHRLNSSLCHDQGGDRHSLSLRCLPFWCPLDIEVNSLDRLSEKEKAFLSRTVWVKENQWISWKVTYWMIANPSGPHCLERSWQRFEKRATLLLFAGDFTDWKAGEWCCTCCHLSSKQSSWWFLLL